MNYQWKKITNKNYTQGYSQSIKHQTPGPGSYQIDKYVKQNTAKYHYVRQKQQDIDKSLQWITHDQRKSIFLNQSKSYIAGPGRYQINSSYSAPSHSWSKQDRFAKNKPKILPGPGQYQYNYNNKRKILPSSCFQSKTPKTVFQSHRNSFHQKIKKSFSFQQKKENIKKDPSYYFISKVPRLAKQNQQSYIGPGSYDIDSQKSYQNTKIITKIIKLQRYNIKKRKNKLEKIGPGSYKLQKYEMSRQLIDKGFPKFTSPRFNSNIKTNQSIPGPGHYRKSKYIYIQPNSQKKVRCRSIPSSLDRNYIDKNQTKLPFYNLNYFNIDNKLKKVSQHFQKLQMMNVSIAAFNSKQSRFKDKKQ